MAASTQTRKLRILALHGYAQNGATIRLKLRRLQDRLKDSLATQYPDGVELICPNGTLSLAEDISVDETDDSHTTFEATRTGNIKDIDLRAWWRNLDTVNRYEGLSQSLATLAALLRSNPVDGIIGFSQGATLATMLVALCEGGSARTTALAQQGEPCHLAPPQAPFKFALLSCGYKGTDKYYDGFYSPRLTTPILFDTATLDHMVAPTITEAWTAVGSSNCQVVSRMGGHWFPNDDKTVLAMVSFATKNCMVASNRISAAWSSITCKQSSGSAAPGVRIRYGLSTTRKLKKVRLGVELGSAHTVKTSSTCKRRRDSFFPASGATLRPFSDGYQVCRCGAVA